MLRAALVISSLTLAIPAYSFEYAMVKGDTLWSLSKRYLKDPYLWPQITYLDGTAVKEPRRMPIGTLLLIPKSIANDRAVIELDQSVDKVKEADVKDNVQPSPQASASKTPSPELPKQALEAPLKDAEKERDVKQSPNPTDLKSSLATAYVSNPSLLAIVERLDANQRTRLWDYWLTHKDGLVRAYYNGQEVVIEAQLLIEEMRHMESKSK